MDKVSLIKERILQIAKYQNVSYEKFFPTIGMSYANFRGDAKKTPINSDAIAILLTKYENINATWLLTGEGEMLKNTSETIQKTNFKRFRNSNKLTQVQAADYFGCTQAFISLIERGESKLPKEYISKIKADPSLDSSMLDDIYTDDVECCKGINSVETQTIISIPQEIWDVIKNQAECLKIKDKESEKQGERIDRLLALLEKKIDNSSDGEDYKNKKDAV